MEAVVGGSVGTVPGARAARRVLARGAALAGVLVIALAAGGSVVDWAADRWVRRDAEAAAAAFVRLVPRPDALEPWPSSFRELSGAVRARWYDADGRPVPAGDGEADDALLDPAMVARVSAGPWATPVGDGHLRAFAPVPDGGTGAAIAELTVDARNARARVLSALWPSVLATLALCCAALGAPFLRARRRLAEADTRARRTAERDPLTGLLHRARFVSALDEAIADHRALNRGLSVFWLDLDGLREVNEARGHAAGDALLRAVAEALAATAGSRALLARFGGDEFVVACPDDPSGPAVAEAAQALLDAVERVGPLSARVGVSRCPTDGTTAAALLKGADLALSRARARPEPGVVLFEREIEAALQARRELEERLRETLARDAFELHFQPLLDARRDRLVGFEALLRMPADAAGATGATGFVSPAVFVPVAEEMGLIAEIGATVLRRACAVAAEWPEHLSVAVNLSPAQFRGEGVHRTVREALDGSGLSPHRLELEITEGLVLGDDAGVMGELAALKALGVKIAMDDFGTGYSSLGYLWKFPFDKIKIDRSFMRAFAEGDRTVAKVVAATLSLGTALGMRVTAEGVETEAQAAFLRGIGCDELQGFLLGRPMPLADVAAAVLADARKDMAGADARGSAAA